MAKFLPGKPKYFLKLPEKIETFRKFACKNRNFLRGSTTSSFQIILIPLQYRDEARKHIIMGSWIFQHIFLNLLEFSNRNGLISGV